ncbi:hypothetical protein cce_5024 [Crocosphaera subtropica ATCC 51142]|uniref:Uncharacterized protein n=1 Tax=Crocosphaera subtropica (strain ATCC 51142 / BH68) TaxID=43989 RepID=B1X2K9_CROS5|nr:hypothetical protein [Crocosphaera subtropica]ACB54370.1 hypothetical protein cce_5024 [Crocosphaera subtropica ATCC 51142]
MKTQKRTIGQKIPHPSEIVSNQEKNSIQLLAKRDNFRYLPLVVILLLVMNLVVTCQNSQTAKKSAQNQPYIYVQQPDGTVIEANPIGSKERTEATIAKFTEDWLKLAFTWKNTTEKKENAFVQERNVNFPQSFHQASLAIEPGYREAYMDMVAKKYDEKFPLNRYVSGQNQSYVRVYENPSVKQVSEGVWDVAIVATRVHSNSQSILAQEIFNHVIRVRAVKPTKEPWGSPETPLEKSLNQMQLQGLQIIEINEF